MNQDSKKTEDLIANIMIIGKTGSGKSSLLNYLVGKEIVSTGVGKPVTSKGEFNDHLIKNKLNFIDSWGLEVDKLSEWYGIITGEINRRIETPTISDDICAIIYLVNAGTGRFEETEKDVIKEFSKSYNIGITVAFSNSTTLTEDQKTTFTKEVQQLSDTKSKIQSVFIESVETEDLNGLLSRTYGKEELVDTIRKACRFSLVHLMTNYINKCIEKLCNETRSVLDAPERFHEKFSGSCIVEVKKAIKNKSYDNKELKKITDLSRTNLLASCILEFLKEFNKKNGDIAFETIFESKIKEKIETIIKINIEKLDELYTNLNKSIINLLKQDTAQDGGTDAEQDGIGYGLIGSIGAVALGVFLPIPAILYGVGGLASLALGIFSNYQDNNPNKWDEYFLKVLPDCIPILEKLKEKSFNCIKSLNYELLKEND